MCSYSLYFSLLSLSKERIGVVVLVSFFFISRSLGDYAILLPPKRAGTRNANFHSDLHEGVDVRTIF